MNNIIRSAGRTGTPYILDAYRESLLTACAKSSGTAAAGSRDPYLKGTVTGPGTGR